jgi:hypothetical protein
VRDGQWVVTCVCILGFFLRVLGACFGGVLEGGAPNPELKGGAAGGCVVASVGAAAHRLTSWLCNGSGALSELAALQRLLGG